MLICFVRSVILSCMSDKIDAELQSITLNDDVELNVVCDNQCMLDCVELIYERELYVGV